MKIGICGPMTLTLLKAHAPLDPALGAGYAFPLTSHLIIELIRRGHQVSAFTHTTTVADTRVFDGDNLTVFVCPNRQTGRARDFFRAERQALRSAIRAESLDLVHAHWSYEFALAAMAECDRTLVTAHDWPPAIFRHKPDPYRAARLLMGMYVLRRAKALTAPSPYLARLVARASGRKVEVVPNGVVFPDTLPARTCNSPLPLRIGAVNNGWNRRKNVGSLLQAFEIARRQIPTAELVLVGTDYEEGGPAWRWARARGLLEGVQFVGSRAHDEVKQLMTTFDVFVHPALEESFGLVIVEAIACGVPVVGGSSSGAVPWVLDFGKIGEVIDVKAPSAIAEAVLLVASDPALARRRADAFRSARERFGLSAVVDQFEALYRYLGA